MKCGFVALVGRPNVGKSTLLNHVLGKKISITSRKAQTTRDRILGIKTTDDVQTIYRDTPGIHQRTPRRLNQQLNDAAWAALEDVDVICWLVEAGQWGEDDEFVLAGLRRADKPIVMVVNKIDKIKDKTKLLPYLERCRLALPDAEVIPLSARREHDVALFEKTIARYLPESPQCYSAEQITDCNDQFIAGELLREKIMRQLGQELPYVTRVIIEKFDHEKKILRIHALITVEKKSQKPIVIGKGGARLKKIGEAARLDMERQFGKKIFLKCWVAVKGEPAR